VDANKAADLLLESRLSKRRLDTLPPDCRPTTQDEANACQRALIERLRAGGSGHPVGYKIACTNPSAQRLLNLDGPFYGLLLSARVHDSPATLDPDDFFMRVIEPEFAFEMGADLPPRDAPYDVDRVAEAVEAVLPAVEIVDSRYNDWTTIGAPSLIADNACAGAWVRGASCRDWRRFDLPAHPVRLLLNKQEIRTGRGDAVMGHPLNPLTWLANMLCRHGLYLRAGDLVSTGITTEVYQAQPGDELVADFGPIGRVDVRFAPVASAVLT
jgi:2-keto-4-pentenoate hydratase